ncbi:hypothetical protein A2U01_0061706 [Trifolium medium]|uniref:Uncharacterized protein n=1 Tax=Trifolium medium TaxID=97028 RepID=A0A392RV30_9FABA|nr:hypothetical protein [Trifolium medium]
MVSSGLRPFHWTRIIRVGGSVEESHLEAKIAKGVTSGWLLTEVGGRVGVVVSTGPWWGLSKEQWNTG